MTGFGLLVLLVVIATIVGGVLIGLVIATVVHEQVKGRDAASRSKRKRADDPFLERLADEGAVWLEDDGELPELSEDDLYPDEKPKRHEDG